MQSHENINWMAPVNWEHSLNRGLAAWYLVLPNQPGWKSSQWLDLTDPLYGNHGILTDMDPSTDWVSSTRRGGFGAVEFDGVNDFVNVGEAGIPVNTEMTISAWVKLNGTYTTRYAIAARANSSFTTNWALTYSHGGGKRFGFWNTAAMGPEVSTAVVEDDNWHHVAATRAGGTGHWTITVYLDGQATSVTALNDPQSALALDTTIGKFGAATGSEYFKGSLDDLRIYNRALNYSEVFNLYVRSQLGYPVILNRVGLKDLAISATGSPWYYNLQQQVAA